MGTKITELGTKITELGTKIKSVGSNIKLVATSCPCEIETKSLVAVAVSSYLNKMENHITDLRREHKPN